MRGAAILDLGLNGIRRPGNTTRGAEVGSATEPGVGTAIGGGHHARSLVTKTTQLMDTAFDMTGQCGLLAFTNAPTPRQPDSLRAQIWQWHR
jgi:hypothetical protein